jgi:cell division protease FtsH
VLNPPQEVPGWRRALPWFVLLLCVSLLVWFDRPGLSQPVTLRYDEFKQCLARGQLKEIVVEEQWIRGSYLPTPPAGSSAAPVPFQTIRVQDAELVKELDAAKVPYSGVPADTFARQLLGWLLPLGFLFFAFLMLRGALGGARTQLLGFGKSRASLVPEVGTGVRFDDVAGCDEAKYELRQMVEFLRNPGRFTALGARIPKGILLLGPPGTGKTLLARAVAGEAGVPFFSISGSEFVEMFVGVGAARVRDLFVQAKSKAPCIVFIDEIDAVGRQRGIHMGVVNDEREQTLNQLLSEMDGFEANSGVILLAATNRPEVLDRALLRPGRFDRQVVLDAPDLAGREAILRVHARGKPLAPDVDLALVARTTPGMSGADLANALNEAALGAAQLGHERIEQRDIEQAIEKVMAGPERRSRRLGSAEKQRIATHESGHALLAWFSKHADPVRKISIVPRGRAALGYTLQVPAEEQFLKTREQLEDRIRVLLGGRAAEELVLGDVSTGAQDDLQSATALARLMIGVFGMNERVGLPTCAQQVEGRFLAGEGSLQRDCSEATAREMDEETRSLLQRAHGEARATLEAHRTELDRVARALLERETLDGEGFEALMRGTSGREAAAREPALAGSA